MNNKKNSNRNHFSDYSSSACIPLKITRKIHDTAYLFGIEDAITEVISALHVFITNNVITEFAFLLLFKI